MPMFPLVPHVGQEMPLSAKISLCDPQSSQSTKRRVVSLIEAGDRLLSLNEKENYDTVGAQVSGTIVQNGQLQALSTLLFCHHEDVCVLYRS